MDRITDPVHSHITPRGPGEGPGFSNAGEENTNIEDLWWRNKENHMNTMMCPVEKTYGDRQSP